MAPPAFNYNLVIKELEKGCELTAMLRMHLGVVLKDGIDSQFGHLFEEISHTLALSREILTKSDQNLLETKLITSHASESPKCNKRKRDEKLKVCQRRKYNKKRTEVTPMPDYDGYQWRKYGQKNILNQRYPRCYYKCTYHLDRNCIAAKQVQRCNDDEPSLFEVTYFDEHTCNIAIPNSKSTINHNIIDFSGKSKPENKFSSNTVVCRRQKEEATVLSCLTNVVKGYSSGISENPNGGNNALNTSNESSVSMDDDNGSIESTFLQANDFPVHETPIDLQWLEEDNFRSLLELL